MSTFGGKTVLVTGASGQLGRRLVPALIKTGYKVKAHYRSADKASRWCPAGAERVIGDLLEPQWLNEALRSCDIVIHCAAIVSLRPRSNDLMKRVNVDGTRSVVEACLFNGVKRLIFVSSIVTVGASENGTPVNEDADFNLAGFKLPYINTKKEAEALALAANSDDFEVIVLNPSIMISSPDRELTDRDRRKIPRRIPVYFDFSLNLVETDDVVSGIIAAIDKGRSGQRYLLTGDNIDPARAFALAAKYLRIKRPFVKIPIWMLYPVAVIAEIIAKIRNKRPKFHRGLARLAKLRFVYSHEKAGRELGYAPRSLNDTLDKIAPSIGRRR